MTSIGLVIRPGIPQALKLGQELCAWAKKNKHKIVFGETPGRNIGLEAAIPSSELVKVANPIVVLGGDGTLIGVARFVGGKSPVFLGVNFGKLGFLTELTPKELFSSIDQYFKRKALIGERTLLLVEVKRAGKRVFQTQALNDAVVQKGARAGLIEIDLSVNKEDLTRVRADGVIVSTPTGSTAYSLAAGGSISEPDLPVMLVTPICPHSLTSRPVILGMNSHIAIKMPTFNGRVFLIVDGQESIELEEGDEIEIRKSKNKVKFVRSPSRSYFEILRSKLNWGVPNRGD